VRGDESTRGWEVVGDPVEPDQSGAALGIEEADPEEAAAGFFPPALGPYEPIPGPEARLREQINTLRAEAGPGPGAQHPTTAPGEAGGDAPGLAAATGLPSWLGWTVLIGGGFMAAIPAAHLLVSRRRRKASAHVADGGVRGPEPMTGAAARVSEEAVLRAEFEKEMRQIRGSILEVVQLVESIHSRIGEPPGMEAGHEPVIADEPEARGPWRDRDLSMSGSSSAGCHECTLPAPSTADGRDLTAIRRAVLRLAEEGWQRDRIAERLHLGHADVGLILRSGRSRAAAGEQRASWTGVN